MGLFGGGQSKAAARSSDDARQKEEIRSRINQGLASLIPGSPEYTQLQALGQMLEDRSLEGAFAIPELGGQSLDQQQAATALAQKLAEAQGQRISAGGAATPLEARTDLATKGLREASANQPFEQDLFDALAGGGAPIDTDAGKVFADLQARAVDPSKYYESTFQPALDLAQERVKARAAQRGILGSGLELENLGRTGAELAIREGEAKDQFRRQSVNDFYEGVFNPAEQLRNRNIGTEEALMNIQLGRESNLTGLLAKQTYGRDTDQAGLRERQTERAYGQEDQARAEESARTQQIGQLLGAGAGLVFGGPAGASVGSRLGGLITENFNNVGGLLGESRSPNASGGSSTDLASLLRRTPGSGSLSPEDFAEILRQGGF